MPIEVGVICLVKYDGFREWHQRLVTGHVAASEYVVVTPDFEMFVEELSLGNPDLGGLRVPGVGEDAVGLPQEHIYGFGQVPRGEQLQQLLNEGHRLATLEREHRGLPPLQLVAPGFNGRRLQGGGRIDMAAAEVPTAVAVVPDNRRAQLISPPGGQWIVDEPLEHFEIGDAVQVPAGIVCVGGRAIVNIDGALAAIRFVPGGESISEYAVARRALLTDDTRTIAANAPGNATKTFAECVRDMPVDAEVMFKLAGPRTAAAYCDRVAAAGLGGMVARHEKWVRESGINPQDRLMYEHQNISRALEMAAVRDGLNIKNLECMELLFRRLQLQEEAVAENPVQPSFEGAEHFMGTEDLQRRSNHHTHSETACGFEVGRGGCNHEGEEEGTRSKTGVACEGLYIRKGWRKEGFRDRGRIESSLNQTNLRMDLFPLPLPAFEGGTGRSRTGTRDLPLSLIKSVGRWSEKWRYERLDPDEWRPRDRALATLCDVDLPVLGSSLLRPDRDWKVRHGFPEVPGEVVEPSFLGQCCVQVAFIMMNLSLAWKLGRMSGLCGTLPETNQIITPECCFCWIISVLFLLLRRGGPLTMPSCKFVVVLVPCSYHVTSWLAFAG